ncbi:MAG: hypothetical protein H0X34_15545 [Chthoniobacterales bacterium]|nr:hypothetical protein [Chthoniobacterales bacterium]
MRKIPTNWGQVFILATKMYNGLVAFAAAIPVTMVNAAQMLASKTAFRNVGNTFNTSRNTLRNAYEVSKPAQDALYEWLLTVRAVLARRLGSRWSVAWAEAGFVSTSTAVPKTIEGRIALGLALVTYYTDNPSYEVADLDVTAAKATELTDAADSGQQGVTTAELALKDADTARRPTRVNLLDLMSTLVANLDKKLAKDDPRWLAFGLEMPSTPTTPVAPTGLRATVMGMEILLECDATPLATRYRFRTRILDVENEFKLVASSLTPMAMLDGIAAGITLEIIVQAVNGNSQSVASTGILVTMPPVAAEKPVASEAELAPLAAIAPNGNGNGNGSLAVSRLS